jgi:gas vesicle protein
MNTNTVKKKLMWLADVAGDDILDAVGLQRKHSAAATLLPIVGVFGMGMIVGGGLALVFAPKKGDELRRDIKDKANEIKDRLASQATEVVQDVKGALPFGEKGEARMQRKEDNATGVQNRAMPKAH